MEQTIDWGRVAAVVTGGTRGIGLGLAVALARRGAGVTVTYAGNREAAAKAEAELKAASAEQKVLLLSGDVGDPAVVDAHHQAAVDAFGPVGVLVNNAGIMPRARIDEIADADWNEVIRVNLNGAFYWLSRVIPGMKAAKFGRVVNVSSIAARGGGVIGPHYAASKAGLLGLTRYSAREMGEYGVTVNAIAPAFIEDAGPFATWTEEQKAGLKEKVAMPYLGRVTDCVRAFEYLLDTPFVTGVCLDVCGGAFMI